MSEMTFTCPYCGVQLSATDELFGQVTNCPSCRQQFQVPTPQGAGVPRAPYTGPPRPGQGGRVQPQGAGQAMVPAQQQQQQQRPYGAPDQGYGAPGQQPGMAPQQGGAPYGPPGVNPRQRYAVMQTSDWAVVLLLMMLPVVGIVMLFVWAFSEGNLNRRNFARAQLIFVGVFFVMALIFGAFSFARLKNVLDQPPPAPTKAAGF